MIFRICLTIGLLLALVLPVQAQTVGLEGEANSLVPVIADPDAVNMLGDLRLVEPSIIGLFGFGFVVLMIMRIKQRK
jgi:hypothetical protein